MVFHPVVRDIAAALKARRNPPPPMVNKMHIDVVRRYAHTILQHPARRDIAEALLMMAIRLDVMGFYSPRDQLLLLVGCGLSAAEITDSLERKHARQAGAHDLMRKARSKSATPVERMMAEGTDTTSTGVGLRSRQRRGFNRDMQQRRQERLRRSKEERDARNAAQPTRSEPTQSGRGPAPRRDEPPEDPTRGRRKPPGPSGRGGPVGRE